MLRFGGLVKFFAHNKVRFISEAFVFKMQHERKAAWTLANLQNLPLQKPQFTQAVILLYER